MKKYGILFVVFAASLLLAASTVPALSASPIIASGDTYVQRSTPTQNFNGSVNEIFVKRGNGNPPNPTRRGYVEFPLDSALVSVATLHMYNFLDGGVDQTVVEVRGAQYSFNETTLTYSTEPDNTDPGTWTLYATWGTVGQNGLAVGWYTADVTSLYNASLGQTVTFRLWCVSRATDQNGNKFRDNRAANGDLRPYIDYTPVPEPSSLLALATGLFGLAGVAIRKRR